MFGGGGGRIFVGNIGGIHVAVSPEVVIIAFASAIILAIAASVIPVWYIARVNRRRYYAMNNNEAVKQTEGNIIEIQKLEKHFRLGVMKLTP